MCIARLLLSEFGGQQGAFLEFDGELESTLGVIEHQLAVSQKAASKDQLVRVAPEICGGRTGVDCELVSIGGGEHHCQLVNRRFPDAGGSSVHGALAQRETVLINEMPMDKGVVGTGVDKGEAPRAHSAGNAGRQDDDIQHRDSEGRVSGPRVGHGAALSINEPDQK